ncbi:sulfatase family protein [Candidatus Halobonum tyrrellensis]|uniref:Arylsulfatase n=1 Tax=Candidatus Halobonum tyrrellensis G22 TaxID=1324957 RepID=V4HGP8_9EURY|nr:sulfatase-like hydrolase/transferase [Candidatus Halobonum tyrrellensis]ESP86989.1 arylsulfatase [Candidatus Halobonum tyrrellensis G22]
MSSRRPNVLFVMTDQQRFDTVGALGYDHVDTPNLDRLVDRGVACTNAYSSAPVCVPARHNVRTGCDPTTTGYLGNDKRPADHLEDAHGPFLARAMCERGYRTFGVGKFHAHPDGIDLGYDRRLTGDDYAAYAESVGVDPSADTGRLAATNFLPQSSGIPPEHRRMAWIADETEAELRREDDRPFFGLVSFSKPHPAWNPSPPFDDYYDPDDAPDPIRGERTVDHADEKVPAQNHHFWKARDDDTGLHTTRVARAHYYGLVTQLDREVGRVLDAVEARDDAANTLVCFFSDHGELLGDHRGWGKTSFFEQSTRVPFLLSWPAELEAGRRYDGLVSLTDLFGIATTAAGAGELRDGADLLGALTGTAPPRERLVGCHETPRETDAFSIPHNATAMVREDDWKYVYAVDGGREQLFDLGSDPRETADLSADRPAVVDRLRGALVEHLRGSAAARLLDGDGLLSTPYERIDMGRYHPETYGPFAE